MLHQTGQPPASLAPDSCSHLPASSYCARQLPCCCFLALSDPTAATARCVLRFLCPPPQRACCSPPPPITHPACDRQSLRVPALLRLSHQPTAAHTSRPLAAQTSSSDSFAAPPAAPPVARPASRRRRFPAPRHSGRVASPHIVIHFPITPLPVARPARHVHRI